MSKKGRMKNRSHPKGTKRQKYQEGGSVSDTPKPSEDSFIAALKRMDGGGGGATSSAYQAARMYGPNKASSPGGAAGGSSMAYLTYDRRPPTSVNFNPGGSNYNPGSNKSGNFNPTNFGYNPNKPAGPFVQTGQAAPAQTTKTSYDLDPRQAEEFAALPPEIQEKYYQGGMNRPAPQTTNTGQAAPAETTNTVTPGVDLEGQQKRLEDISKGTETLSDATKIQQAKIIGEDGLPEGTVTTAEDIQQLDPAKQLEAKTAAVDVQAAQGTQAAAPQDIKAAGFQAAQVGDLPVAEAAAGAVSKLVDAGQANFDPALQGETISPEEIEEGKAMSVEGALSSGAFAEAAKGEASKIDLGGIPSLDEIDMMDVTVQAEVAELPPEALVSTQMDSLLQGMEEGKTPAWAIPALNAVEQQLAARGMSASSVGRTALFSAIVSAALPIAQSNATALKERATQNLANRQQAKITEATLQQQGKATQFQATAELMALNAKLAQEMGVAELSAEQQTGIYNATAVAGMDMANLNNKQQVALANAKWMQTASLANLSNEQQSVLAQASLLATQDLANADAITKASIANAQNFLAMDMANLNNEQQASLLNTQSNIQKLFTNQAATNAARQFNAASENQINQFMAQLQTQVALQNSAQSNAMAQFNTQQQNLINTDIAKLNAQLETQVDQFNEQSDFQRDAFNAQNAQAIEQSNIQWRRQANTADTAAANAINQQNAMNSFNLESSALSMLWQQLRDEAAFDQQSYISHQQNITNLYAAALQHAKPKATTFSKIDSIVNTTLKLFGGGD